MKVEHRRREPAPGVYRLVLPLPFPGLARVNAYLLSDDSGPTLIDCGMKDPAAPGEGSWGELRAALGACGVSPEDVTRLVITHPHVDHYGLAGALVEASGCDVWMHADASEELEVYRDPGGLSRRVAEMLVDHGVDPADVRELSAFEDWRPFITGVVEATRPLQGGEKVRIGPRSWEVVHTPGHARSHICLYSEDGILISGDHILPAITPHIDFQRGAGDPLGDYLRSLATIERLAPDLVLPGHGRPFDDGAERARAIARHHDRRLGSILQVIRHRPCSASEITDEVFGSTLLNFERRLALGEALAHLAYLRRRGEVERIRAPDGTYLYRKASPSRRPVADD